MTDHSSDVVVRFAALLSSLESDRSGLDRLCEAGCLLIDADGAAVTRMSAEAAREVWSTTNELAAVVEDAHEVAGEGPAFDAWQSGEIVQGGINLGEPAQWPFLEDRLVRIGFSGSIVAIPLVAGRTHIGVFVAYRWLRRMEIDHQAAFMIGHTIGSALLDEAVAGHASGDLGDDWPSRSVIHQATGMIVAQVSVPPAEALALLRARAYAQGAKLDEVAGSIVGRQVRFDNFSMEGD